MGEVLGVVTAALLGSPCEGVWGDTGTPASILAHVVDVKFIVGVGVSVFIHWAAVSATEKPLASAANRMSGPVKCSRHCSATAAAVALA